MDYMLHETGEIHSVSNSQYIIKSKLSTLY